MKKRTTWAYRAYGIAPVDPGCHITALPFQKRGLKHWHAPRWYGVFVGLTQHNCIPLMPSINRAKIAIRIWERFCTDPRRAKLLMLLLTVNPRNYSGCYGRYMSPGKIVDETKRLRA